MVFNARIFFGLFFLVFSLAGCASLPEQEWTGNDKLKHFAAAAAISAGSSSLASRHHSADKSAVIGVSVTMLIGTGKEVHDMQQGRIFSWPDMLWNFLGAITGAAVVQ